MRTFLAVVLLIGVGYWLAVRFAGSKTPSQVVQEEVRSAVAGTVSNVLETFEPEKLKAQVAESGEAIKTKAVEIGHQVAAGTEDARITAAIKTRLARKDPASALGVSVSTTGGLVTLSGAVKSGEQIRAFVLEAMDVPGVREVVSTLQIRP